jgi:pyruvate dehydrogenase E1 component alpha subunit
MSGAIPPRAESLEILRRMLLVRRFEDRCAEAYGQGHIRGFLHLYNGEEAVAAGAMAALGPDDAVVATYREHGHAILRGIPAAAVMAEMYGRANGCARGRGGSMHMFSAAHRFYGGFAIVGGGLPLAVGLALADRMRERRRVTACFFGDGATDEGEYHESLNLASLWRLPVLFLCENNLYAMGTRLERHAANTDLRREPEAHGIPAASVDGMDVIEVGRAAREAAGAVRRGEGPRFLEMRTYRFRAHSMYDAEKYRERAEVEEWRARDPIRLFEARLRDAGILLDADRASLQASVEEEVEEAARAAESGPPEPVEDLERFVYAREGP